MPTYTCSTNRSAAMASGKFACHRMTVEGENVPPATLLSSLMEEAIARSVLHVEAFDHRGPVVVVVRLLFRSSTVLLANVNSAISFPLSPSLAILNMASYTSHYSCLLCRVYQLLPRFLPTQGLTQLYYKHWSKAFSLPHGVVRYSA